MVALSSNGRGKSGENVNFVLVVSKTRLAARAAGNVNFVVAALSQLLAAAGVFRADAGLIPIAFPRDVRAHIIRTSLSLLALVITAALGLGPAAIIAGSLGLFLAAFAAQHDLLHGALRVPRNIRELVLSAVGAILLMSGHAVRAMHLRHHARIFAADDLEGASARMSALEALLASPVLSIRLRLEALRTINTRDRRFMLAENAINAASLLALPLLFDLAGALYVATALTLQLTMPIWAGRIPHRAPDWMIACAKAFAFTRSPTMLSLAFHDLHHEHPRVPTANLATLART